MNMDVGLGMDDDRSSNDEDRYDEYSEEEEDDSDDKDVHSHEDSLQRLCEKMSGNETTEDVDLFILSNEDCDLVEDAIQGNHIVRSLTININLNAAVARIPKGILEFVRNSPFLRDLELSDIAEPELVNEILLAVKENPLIQAIGFSLNDTTCNHAIDLLTTSKTLKCLQLSILCDFSQRQKSDFILAITSLQCSISELILDGQRGDHVFAALMKVIPGHHSIKSIKLIAPGQKSQFELLNLLRTTQSLEQLSISDWTRETEIQEMLEENIPGLIDNSKLHTLELASTDMDCALLDLIVCAKALQTLHLRFDEWHPFNAWDGIFDAIIQNGSISSFSLEHDE